MNVNVLNKERFYKNKVMIYLINTSFIQILPMPWKKLA